MIAGAGRDPDPMAALVAREADAVRRTERERQTNLAIGVLAAVEAVVRALAPLPGRKSLLFISEGFVRIEEGGEEAIRIVDRIRRLVDTANRASVVIYSLDPGGLRPLSGSGSIGPVPSAASAPPDPFTTRSGTTGGMSSGMSATQLEREMRAGLTELSQDTGGLTLFDNNDLAQIARVIDDQRGYYLLGYVPDEPIALRAKDEEPRYFKIDVKVKRKGLQVRSRKGFVATATAFDESAPPPGIVDTVMSPFAAVDVPVRLTALYNHDRDRGAVIRCLLHVDAQTLTFEDNADGTKQVVVEAVAAAIDARGRIARHIGATYTMTLGARMVEAARRGGFVLTLDLPVKESGAHQVRVAARDTISGHAGSASQFLVVPDLGNGRLALTGIVMEGAPEASASEEASLDDGTETWKNPDTTSAVRRFRTNGSVAYGFGVYNARRPPAGGEPDLAVFLNLYRDGARVQSMVKVSPAMSPATAETPIAVASALRLGSAVPPGSYTLEVMVADRLRGGKDSVAVQSVDFEVVP